MARVGKRVWKSRGVGGRRVRKTAWGYSLVVDGRQQKAYRESWTKDDAERALAERVLGIEAKAKAPSATVSSFGKVVERYLEVKASVRSLPDQRAALGRMAVYFGADTPIAEVTSERVAQYQSARKAEPSKRRGPEATMPVSPATVNREVAALRHMLVLAEEWGLIAKVPRIRMLREPEGRLRFLTEEEVARLLSACAASPSAELHAVVKVALNTGMRRGEVLGLTWDRVDFARGVLLLERTKSGRRREVPMNGGVYDVLSAITGRREGRVFSVRSVRKPFERAVREARLEDFRFHDLRHTAASHLMMRGASLADVRAVLGHATLAMTMRYAHLSPEHLRSAVARLDGLGAAKETPAAHGQRTVVESPADAP